MKIKELVEKLKEFDEDMEVFLDDEHEGWHNSLHQIEVREEFWTPDQSERVDAYDVVVFVRNKG